jgi:hypothetical protein
VSVEAQRNVVRPEDDAWLLQERTRAVDITHQLRVSEYRQRGRNVAADADIVIVIVSMSVPRIHKECDKQRGTTRQHLESSHLESPF